jgi:hypothetical protein
MPIANCSFQVAVPTTMIQKSVLYIHLWLCAHKIQMKHKKLIYSSPKYNQTDNFHKLMM